MGLLSSIGSALGTVFATDAGVAGLQGAMDFGTAMWQNTQAKKAATKAYNREVALWSMNNEYNTPAAQVQRLKDAGLNPALIYGTGSSVATGNSKGAAHAPQASTPSRPNIDFLSALSMGQDIKMKQAQTANIERQNEVIQRKLDILDTDKKIKIHNLEYAKAHNQPVGQGEDRTLLGRAINLLRGNYVRSRAVYDPDLREPSNWIDVPIVGPGF